MKHFIAFCRRNRLFAALLAAELAVVCALAAGLFGAPYKLTLTPGDFTNTLPDIAAADDDGLKIWNQIGYHSDDPMTFSADNIALPSGAYEVTVRYFSCQTPDAPTFNMLNAAGSLTFASERSPAAVTFDALRLDDCHRGLTTRLWVGFGARMQDLTATVTYDQGQLYIYSITLTEQPIYRAARLLCFLVLFAAADAALLLLFAHVGERGAARRRALRLPLALAGITLLACLPLFSNYLYFGHDLEFHMQRIAAMAAELSYGQFPVRLTTTTLNGYGYASPLCYCELFLLLPALLYNLWLPLRTCYQVYLFAVTLATCLIAYFSFAKITASRRLGLLGALLYTLSAYRLTCVYTRAAVGEFTAMVFFPLVLLGLYGIYTSDRPRFGDWLPMALGMAAMVQSHLLSCELTALLLILFCLLRLQETLRPARLLAWVKAALLAVGLSAWYLFPFFISTRSIPFLVNRSDLVGKLQKHGLYAVQLFSFFGTAGGSSAEGTTHDMALTPGLPLLLALALAFYCLWGAQARGDTRPAAKHLYTATGFAVLTLVLSLHAFPWDFVEGWFGPAVGKVVGMFQFPFRFLSLGTLLLCAAALFALQLLPERRAVLAAAGLVCAALLTASITETNIMSAQGESSYAAYNQNATINSVGTAEYLIDGASSYEAIWAQPKPASGDLHLISYEKREGVAYVSVENDGGEAAISLPIYNYGNYYAADESGAAMSMCRMLEAPEIPEDFSVPVEVSWERLSMEEAPLVTLFDAGNYPGWVACAKLVRRELVQSYLFCPRRVYEDNEAVCHWIYGAKTIASIPHSLYFYRTNPGSTTQSRFSMKKLDYLWALEGIIRFYSSVGYLTLRERFGTLYAEEAAGCYYRVKHELNDTKAARNIEKAARRLRREIPFTKAQFETMFSAMHPKLVRLYWPLEGAARTLREDGVSGLTRKIGKHLRKGEHE